MVTAAIGWWVAQSGVTGSDIDLLVRGLIAAGVGLGGVAYLRKFQKDFIDTASVRQLELIAEIHRKEAENADLRKRNTELEHRIDELEDENRHGQRVIETLRDLHAATDTLTDLMDPATPDPPEET